MPVHDWSRVEAGLFHHFHHGWTAALSNALNAGGVLPPGFFCALGTDRQRADPRRTHAPEPRPSLLPNETGVGVACTTAPRVRHVAQAEPEAYARRANRVTIRHPRGKVVAVIEIVSPGNKDSRHALRSFVEKAAEFLRQGIHLLVIDLFPPTKRDPSGIHKAIWDEIRDEPFELPPDKPLTLAAYSAGEVKVAYVEPVAVGDCLPAMPLFLEPEGHVLTPLEATYQATWNVFPPPLRKVLV